MIIKKKKEKKLLNIDLGYDYIGAKVIKGDWIAATVGVRQRAEIRIGKVDGVTKGGAIRYLVPEFRHDNVVAKGMYRWVKRSIKTSKYVVIKPPTEFLQKFI